MNLYIGKEGIANIFQNINLTDAAFYFFFKNRENLYLTEDASEDYESQVKGLIKNLSPRINQTNEAFQNKAEKYYGTNQSVNPNDNDLKRVLLQIEGCDYTDKIPEGEKSNTFYLSKYDNPNSIWVKDESKDAYQTLNDWLKHSLFRRVNLDNNGWENFINETFDDDTLSKLTDVIIYDPYFLFNIYIHGEPVLIKRIKDYSKNKNKNKQINIVVFTDSIEKYYHPLKDYTDKNRNFIFIQIPKGAHDRFIIANNMFVSSGKGFVLDSDKSTDIIAYKEGCIDKNIATLWKNKINNLNSYVSNEPRPVSLGNNQKCSLLDLTNLQQVEEPSGPNVPNEKELSGNLVGALKNWLNTKSLAYDNNDITEDLSLKKIAEKILDSHNNKAKPIFVKDLIKAYRYDKIQNFREVLIKLHNNYPQDDNIKKLLNISDYNFSINNEYICLLIQTILGEISVDDNYSFSSAKTLRNLFLDKIKGNELGSYNLGALIGNIKVEKPPKISTDLDDIKKTFDNENFNKKQLIEPIIYLARFKYIQKES